jgi:hypothetical protein
MKAAICAVVLALGLTLTWSARSRSDTPATPETEQVRALVRQLDDRRFATREEADRALRKRGLGIVPRLRQELTGPVTLEVQRRLERIIADLIRLDWHRDLAAAVREASKSGKPILAFSTMGTPDGFA